MQLDENHKNSYYSSEVMKDKTLWNTWKHAHEIVKMFGFHLKSILVRKVNEFYAYQAKSKIIFASKLILKRSMKFLTSISFYFFSKLILKQK